MSTFKINITGNDQTSLETTKAVYSDYNQNPVSTAPNIVMDLKCIQQSLDNLFHSHKNHRRYMPWYYVPINNLIGELNGTNGAIVAISQIARYVERNEPRVSCDPLLTTIENTGEHMVRLDLVITVRSLQENLKYTYSTELSI